MLGTLGGPELILILVIALIIFGPRKLPEIGKSMGKMLYEFRKASTDFQRTIQDEVEAEKRSEAAVPAPAIAAVPAPSEPPAAAPESPALSAPEAPTVSRGAEIK